MPDSYGAKIKTTTETSGTGSYLLNTANLPTNHRTPKQAVADGSLVDGDTVQYFVVDSTDTGEATFEWGEGVYDDTLNTISRLAANVWDSSDSPSAQGPGVLVSWGASGVRDVIFMSTPAVRNARVDKVNTFTENQKIDVDVGVVLVGESSNSIRSQVQINNTDEGAGPMSELSFGHTGEDSIPNGAVRFSIKKAQLWTGVANTRDGLLEIDVRKDNVLGARVSIDADGVITDVSTGNEYIHFASGTALPFFQSSPPTGWTQDVTNADAALRVVSGSGGGTAGTLGLSSATVPSHTLVEAEIPAHTHVPGSSHLSFRTIVDLAGGSAESFGAGSATFGSVGFTGPTGGTGGHTHPLALKTIDVIVATKD